MMTKYAKLFFFFSLVSWVMACTMVEDSLEPEPQGEGTFDQDQVELYPVFTLEGLDHLPAGLHLDDLHLGVGALFFEPVEVETGIAYANRMPFQLHFWINDGTVMVEAPSMILPAGGLYHVSVQLEPQQMQGDLVDYSLMGSTSSSDEDESSLSLNGSVVLTVSPGDYDADPRGKSVPLPWRPDPPEVEGDEYKSLTWTVIPFHYRTAESVRFSLGEVDLNQDSEVDLLLQVPLGEWVEESVRPALEQVLDDLATGEELEDLGLEGMDLDLTETMDNLSNGIDGLIGGIEVVVR